MNEELPFSNEVSSLSLWHLQYLQRKTAERKITIVSINTSDEMLGVHVISGGALIELRISFAFAYFDAWA